MSILDPRKAAMIGCGAVGAASVFALMESGLFSEIVMIDANQDKAEGEALDISHGLPFARPMKIYEGGYDDLYNAGMVIVSAGAAQKPGETRLDLVKKNISIFKKIIPEISKRNPSCIMLIVANPVDVLTYAAQKISGMPEKHVFGSGTVLDTARLKYLIGEHLSVDSRSVHAYIVGEHGDSEFAAWSSVNVSGVPLHRFCEMKGHFDHIDAMQNLEKEVRESAYRIIEKKGATCYGIAMTVKRICEAVMRDEHSILPLSVMQHGMLGVSDVALSTPVIVGSDGIEGNVPLALDNSEKEKLRSSADALKKVIAEAEI